MNIQSSFTVYTAALHALILILFSLHTSGLGYPGLTWIYCISTNKSFSSPKTSSRTPYSNSKQHEKQKHSAETTINVSCHLASLRCEDCLGASVRARGGTHSGWWPPWALPGVTARHLPGRLQDVLAPRPPLALGVPLVAQGPSDVPNVVLLHNGTAAQGCALVPLPV